MPMTDEDIDNFGTGEYSNSPLQGAVKNLFGTNQNNPHFYPYYYDQVALNEHIDSYNRQRNIAAFFTPTNQRNHFSSNLNTNSISTRKDNLENGLTNAKRIQDLQQSIFTPTKTFRYHPGHIGRSLGSPDALQPTILHIARDSVIDSEVLRSKRSLIAKGPPLLPDEPTVIQFCEWRTAITKFLKLVPGFQLEMLTVPPNLDGLLDEHYKSIIDRYDLIFDLLVTATDNNKLVTLKTNDITRSPISDIVSWWAVVINLFQPSDIQIKILHDKFKACVQKPGQSGTKYLNEIETKAGELRKLGEYFNNVEIGSKVFEGLNFPLQQFVYTNFMAQKITCNSASIALMLKNYEDMEARNESNSVLSQPNSALLTVSNETNNQSFHQFSHPNKRFKRNDGDEDSISSQKLSGSISLKGNNPSGLLGKVEQSYPSSPLIDENYSKTDEAILKNLDITSAVNNLRKFKKMVRQIKQINGKDEKEPTGNDEAASVTKTPSTSDHRNDSRSSNNISNRHLYYERSNTQSLSRGKSNDYRDSKRKSGDTNYNKSNYYQRQPERNSAQTVSRILDRDFSNHNDKSLTNGRSVRSDYSNSNSRNSSNQRRFRYLLLSSTLYLNEQIISIIRVSVSLYSLLEKYILSTRCLTYSMQLYCQMTSKNSIKSDNIIITKCFMMTNNINPINENDNYIDVFTYNTPSQITTGAQGMVHNLGITNKLTFIPLSVKPGLDNNSIESIDSGISKVINCSSKFISNDNDIPNSDAGVS